MIHAVTTTAAQTQELAGSLAAVVQPRDLVLLVGEMGAGKTTFTQGFGRTLGIDEPITSPTFVLMRSYQASPVLHHVDIYRLEHLQEVIDLGLLELLDEGGVALVEWGDLAAPVLPRDFLEVRLSSDEEDEQVRRVEMRGIGAGWAAREKAVADAVAAWRVDEGDES